MNDWCGYDIQRVRDLFRDSADYEIQRTKHFFVQQETCLTLWCGDKETLANAKRLYSSYFLKSERILRKKFVSPDFKWTMGRRLPTGLRSFLTTWFTEDNGQRTNNGIQRRTSQRKGIKL